MNIVIVEQLNKAIRQSNDLFIPEQSLRHQLEEYNTNSIKWYKRSWYC
jgi:hypothetical protein